MKKPKFYELFSKICSSEKLKKKNARFFIMTARAFYMATSSDYR